MHDGQLGLVNANEAAFRFCNGHLLPDLEIAVEEDFFAECPTDVDAADQMLSLLRHLCELVHIPFACIRTVSRLAIRLASIRYLKQ